MFRLPKPLADQIIEHALRENPDECCGLLAGSDGVLEAVYPAENAAHSPYRYFIDSKELLRLFQLIEWGDEPRSVMGNYHSHTHSEAYPSPTDVNEAHLGPDAVYLLVSLQDPQLPEIRAYRIDEEARRIQEEPIEITE